LLLGQELAQRISEIDKKSTVDAVILLLKSKRLIYRSTLEFWELR
jgi:hypothetical protein